MELFTLRAIRVPALDQARPRSKSSASNGRYWRVPCTEGWIRLRVWTSASEPLRARQADTEYLHRAVEPASLRIRERHAFRRYRLTGRSCKTAALKAP